jgi:predicted nucleic acid-binding protein
MTSYLLDTNVVSEVIKEKPDANVVAFLNQAPDCRLSIITLHELNYALGLLPAGRRRAKLAGKLELLLNEYGSCILPVSYEEAGRAALVRADARQRGHIVHLADALIAGTGLVHQLVLVTRNVDDFRMTGVSLLNPWQHEC